MGLSTHSDNAFVRLRETGIYNFIRPHFISVTSYTLICVTTICTKSAMYVIHCVTVLLYHDPDISPATRLRKHTRCINRSRQKSVIFCYYRPFSLLLLDKWIIITRLLYTKVLIDYGISRLIDEVYILLRLCIVLYFLEKHYDFRYSVFVKHILLIKIFFQLCIFIIIFGEYRTAAEVSVDLNILISLLVTESRLGKYYNSFDSLTYVINQIDNL